MTVLTLQLPDGAPKGPHVLPSAIPGSNTMLFTIGSSVGASGAAGTIATLDLTTNAVTPVLTGGNDAQYVSSGHLVYTAGASLWAVRFDPKRSQVLGTAVPVVAEVTVLSGGAVAAYAVSDEGTLVYTSGDVNRRQRTLVWVDRNGRETPLKPLESRPIFTHGCRTTTASWRSTFGISRTTSGFFTWPRWRWRGSRPVRCRTVRRYGQETASCSVPTRRVERDWSRSRGIGNILQSR